MPLNEDLDKLQAMAASASVVEDWPGFARYLDLRARGLRRASMEAVHKFLEETEHWNRELREAFVSWLSAAASDFWDEGLLVSHELLTNLVAPTIREWLSHEPESSLANFLSGKYCQGHDGDSLPLDAFRRSVALDPTCERARLAFVERVRAHARNHQHELPYGYLGPVDTDVHDLKEAREMLAGIRDSTSRETIGAHLLELLETAMGWQRYQQSGARDFAEWCSETNGPSRFVRPS